MLYLGTILYGPCSPVKTNSIKMLSQGEPAELSLENGMGIPSFPSVACLYGRIRDLAHFCFCRQPFWIAHFGIDLVWTSDSVSNVTPVTAAMTRSSRVVACGTPRSVREPNVPLKL